MYHQKKSFFGSVFFFIRGLVNELIKVSHAPHACTVGSIPSGTFFLFLSSDGLGNRMEGSISVSWVRFRPFPGWWRSIAKSQNSFPVADSASFS